MWVRDIYRERQTTGEFHKLVLEMKLSDHELFFRYFRMLPPKFEELLNLVGPHLVKNCCNREPIGPEERLSIILRYLASGNSHTSMSMGYRMSPTTIGRIILETCMAIWIVLLEQGYFKVPSNHLEWEKIADGFEAKWNFPHCVGAIDGKHVVMQAPPRAGSTFYNYKGTHSIVLMAVANSEYQFTMVEIGEAGRQSDGGVFANGQIGYAMNNDLRQLPSPSMLSQHSRKELPYIFVGDEAFPLKTFLIKPYPRGSIGLSERITNYRISRARRVIENAFGICSSRFRIFRRPIVGKTELVIEITKAVVVLHNFLMFDKVQRRSSYFPPGYADEETPSGIKEGGWRAEGDSAALAEIHRIGSNTYSKEAKDIREDFKHYFTSTEGSLPWQSEIIASTLCRFDEG